MKPSVGRETVERLRNFTDALRDGENVSEKFNCRKIMLDLQPEPYDPELVKETRKSLNLSQALFAQLLGVKTRTVQSWEQGENTPADIACRFMDEFRRNPDHWKARVTESIRKIESPTSSCS